jgi:hypothetical protein
MCWPLEFKGVVDTKRMLVKWSKKEMKAWHNLCEHRASPLELSVMALKEASKRDEIVGLITF